MNLFDTLDWSIWKSLSKEIKVQVISQLFMYFVSPLKKISEVHYFEFSQGGIKCETVEFLIDGEPFIFIPGNKETILGWDSGIQGLSLLALNDQPTIETEEVAAIFKNYQLKTIEEWNVFLNESTSPLRKVSIEPMFVQKNAQPIGTTSIGQYNMITGKFTGNEKLFKEIEPHFQQSLETPQSFEESLNWSQPYMVTKTGEFLALQELSNGKLTDNYLLYLHQKQTKSELQDSLDQQVFSLMNEDQWEYAIGAGTRRLFRWGSGLGPANQSQKRMLEQWITENNPFGLSVTGPMPHWELIASPFLKMECSKPSGFTLLDVLPQSSYYRSRHSISHQQELLPEKYFYRKAIILTP